MKRIAWIFAALALAVFATLAVVVVLLPREALKTGIGEQIAAWTGRDVSLRGDPELDFFPEVTVTLKDVQVGGPPAMADAEIVSMERLTGKIRLLPLVIGRVEIGSYRIVRPLIRLIRDDTGARNWAFESGAAALQLAFAGDVPLGDFVMEDGTLIYQNRRDGVIERLDSLNLSVAWPSVRAPLAISGAGIWRGEQFSFSATTDAPFEFIRGETTAIEANLDSVPLAMVFRGTAADFNTPRLTGDLSLTTPSLRGFAAWLGSPIGPGSTLGPASLAGTADFVEGVLSVENARLTLDGNDATGAVKVTASARPDISGTLAFANLDLTPYFSGVVSAVRSGGWQDLDVDTEWFHDLTADVRLSAGSVQIASVRFGQTAASASLREARLEIGIAEAEFSGGALTGDLAISRTPAGPEAIEAQLRASGFDLAVAAPALGLPASLAGTASVAMDIAGHATDLGALLADLGGTASLSVRNGRMPLFGIADFAAGAPANAVLASDNSVTSPVSDLAARLSFAAGAATLEEATVVAADFSVAAAGRIGLVDGSLDVDGSVRPSSGAPPIPFSLNGSLARPVVQATLPTN